MRVLEVYYTPTEIACLMRMHVKTVRAKLRAGEFGSAVVNLGRPDQPEYRVPASAVNAWLEGHRVIHEAGIGACSVRELRQKAA